MRYTDIVVVLPEDEMVSSMCSYLTHVGVPVYLGNSLHQPGIRFLLKFLRFVVDSHLVSSTQTEESPKPEAGDTNGSDSKGYDPKYSNRRYNINNILFEILNTIYLPSSEKKTFLGTGFSAGNFKLQLTESLFKNEETFLEALHRIIDEVSTSKQSITHFIQEDVTSIQRQCVKRMLNDFAKFDRMLLLPSTQPSHLLIEVIKRMRLQVCRRFGIFVVPFCLHRELLIYFFRKECLPEKKKL